MSNGTILMVDDDPVVKQVLFEMLRRAQYDVLEAASGEQALRVLERYTPDLVLLDVGLPGMDGYELAQRLRTRRELSRVPIVLITASQENVVRVVGSEAGADFYALKPFDPQDIAVDVYTVFAHGLESADVPESTLRVFRRLERELPGKQHRVHSERPPVAPTPPTGEVRRPVVYAPEPPGIAGLELSHEDVPIHASEDRDDDMEALSRALARLSDAIEQVQRLLVGLQNRLR